jgi:F-type H+-transporting ATPase subunit b
MEQLITVFGLDWKLLIAQMVNFLILLGVLSYFLYTPVMKMLAERARRIAKGLEDATLAAQSREASARERITVLSEAEHQATLVAARAEEEGKRERASIVKTAETRAEEIVESARKEAAESVRRALKDSEAEMARTAVLAAEKILRMQQ